MGTDIYEVYELRQSDVWGAVNLLPALDTNTSLSDPQWEAYWSHPAYINRNYALFSVLAGIRNTFGIVPIATRRGLPLDASAEAQAKYSYPDSLPTWVTLRELLEYDWNQIIQDTRHTHAMPELLREAVEPFVSKTLPYLQTLVRSPDDLRIICDFD